MEIGLALVLLTVLASTRTYGDVIDTEGSSKLIKDFQHHQIKSYELLFGIPGESDLPPDYDFIDNINMFKDDAAVEEFTKLLNDGILPEGAPFTMRDPETKEQTIKIFDLLFFADNFTIFHNVALWLRPKMNSEQFIHVIALVLVHRDDFYFELSAWYEIFPHYFVPHRDMVKVVTAKGADSSPATVKISQGGNHTLAYFMEDVGLNSLYNNWLSIYFPSWMDPAKYNMAPWQWRGELFYYFHSLILARYDMEAWANGLEVEPAIDWALIVEAYDPDIWKNMTVPLSARNANLLFPDGGTEMNHLEDLIGKDVDEDAFDEDIDVFMNVLYNTTQAKGITNYSSYFDMGVTQMAGLGANPQDQNTEPWNTMGNPMTALRDPAYYQFIRRIVTAGKYYTSETVYGENDLEFSNVTIKKMTVSKLATYFTDFIFDATNGVEDEPNRGGNVRYTVSQRRLSSAPFSVRLTIVNSRKRMSREEKKVGLGAMVRLFLMSDDAPAQDFEEKVIAYEIDRFPARLKKGTNVIIRKSGSSTVFEPDQRDSISLYETFSDDYNNNKNSREEYYYSINQCGLPEGLLLPRGRPKKDGGLKMYLMAFVSEHSHPEAKVDPYKKKRRFDNLSPCGTDYFDDYKAFGYPLDKAVDRKVWNSMSNKKVINVTIIHNEE